MLKAADTLSANIFQCLKDQHSYDKLTKYMLDGDISACLKIHFLQDFPSISAFAEQFDYWTNCDPLAGVVPSGSPSAPPSVTVRTITPTTKGASTEAKKLKKRVVPTTLVSPPVDVKNKEAWPSLSGTATTSRRTEDSQHSAWPALKEPTASPTPLSISPPTAMRSSSPAPSPAALDATQSTLANRMGNIFGLLVHRQILAYDRGIRKICKLLSYRSIPANSHDILINDAAVHVFLQASFVHLLPIVRSIGGTLASSIYHVLKISHADLSVQLQEGDIDHSDDQMQHADAMPTFMRTFDEEKDSRYEYKTKIETAVYNERERCFDDISNLIRQYQQSTLDIDKSSEEDFYYSVLPATAEKLLSLIDVNFMWFADVFRDLLLFNCCNSTASQRINASNRQKNLEARLGAPKPQRKTPTNSSFAKFKSLFSSMDSISAFFKGDQQFFYRFILIADSHRFNSLLIDSIISEISTLSFDEIDESPTRTNKQSSVASLETDSNKEFTQRAMKLCLLGRFLGLLCFYPYWNLTVSTVSGGPLVASSKRNINQCRISRDTLLRILEKAHAEERLSLSMTWISNYLHMSSWDASSAEMYRSSILYLQSISMKRNMQSNNRVYILIAAQHVLSRFSAYFMECDSSHVVVREPEDKNTIDAQNLSFSKRFIDHVTPLLGEALQFCQRRLASEKTRSPSIDLPQTPRRQMAQFLSPSKSLAHSSSGIGLGIGIADTIWSPKDTSMTPRTLRSLSQVDDRRDKDAFLQRLQASFWNQHPHLQQISTFVVDRLFVAAKQHLREHIAQSVYQAWSIIDQVNRQDDINVYTTLIQKELGKLHQSSYKAAKTYLEGFVKDNLQASLSRLYAMYPTNIRIQNMALHLTLQQRDKFVQSLLEYFSAYSKKKLQEVCNVSVAQLIKAGEKSPVADEASPCSLTSSQYATIIHNIVASAHKLTEITGVVIVDDVDASCDACHIFKVQCSCKLDCSDIDMRRLYDLNESVLHLSHELTKYLSIFLSLHTADNDNSVCGFDINSNVFLWCFYRSVLQVYLQSVCTLVASSQDDEVRGRVRIEACKLYTSIAPLIVDIDTAAILVEGASSINLLHVYHNIVRCAHILDIEAWCRILTIASKSTAVTWSVKSKYLRYRVILSSIGAFLTDEKNSELEIDLREETWARDPAVRRMIKMQVSPSLSVLVEVLSKVDL